MVDRRLHRSLWWARLRLRWRRYARALEITHALDATVTGGLVVAGIITATSNAPDSTKVSIVVLLGVAELVWFFGRIILSEVKSSAHGHLMSCQLICLPQSLITSQGTRQLACAGS